MSLDFIYEDEKQEFKSSLAQLDNGVNSLAAMLNKHCNGSVYFGVDNKGKILGLDGQLGEETIKKISTRIALMVKPTIIPEITFENHNQKIIIKVSAKGNNRPYSSNGNYLIRVGSENKHIEPDLLADLFFSSQTSSIENFQTFNQNLTFNYLKQMFIEKKLTINNEQFNENMHFLINGKFNYLANLLADENDISIKVVRFNGLDKTKMILRNEYGFKCLLLAMQKVNDYILSLNETKVDLDSKLERKETKLFDSHAFEEAWTNACLHNKWIRNIPPAVYIFDNRIEIISTGGLPFDYSEEEFYKGVSHPINIGLQKIMGQLGLVEQTGHGNLAIIAKYGRGAFDIGKNYITVTIPFAFTPSMKSLNYDGLLPYHIKILELIKNYPSASIAKLAKEASLGTTRVSEIIKELKQMKKIERKGSKKGGYWILL